MKKTIKITNEQILDSYDVLLNVTGKMSRMLSYGISLYKNILVVYVNTLKDVIKSSDGYKEYDTARYNIIQSCAVTDIDGNTITVNGSVKIKKEMFQECKMLINELDIKYSDVINDRKKEIIEIDNILKKEVEFTVECININDIPEEIDQTLMDVLLPIINREGSE